MKKISKSGISLFVTLCMATGWISLAQESETAVSLSDSGITVNGEAITTDNTEKLYLQKKTETHGDVPEELKDTENRVITVTDAGTYRFSGTATDTQIAVAADENDEVTLILDGVDITCRTAPAILVYSAKEPAEVGKSGVTLSLADSSVNNINGSHTARINDDDIKYDAAVSSAVSLTVEGNGTLNITADNEGLEVKNKHLTINSGNIRIISCDDPINGSEDGVSHITINGGWIFCSSENGKEGDGIDSNGYITVNGGTLIALGNPNSADGGLDSDMGTTVNGGTVVGAGNMYDPLENNGEQLFMYLQFADTTDNIICITDSEGKPVFAYDFPFNYQYISFSSPELEEGEYRVYLGGEIEGTEKDGLYTEITSYTGGTPMYHGGVSTGNRRPGGMNFPEGMTPPEGMEHPQHPEGMEFPEGMERPQRPDGMEFPEGMERPQRPDGMDFPEGMQRPQGGRRPGGMQSSSATSTDIFTVSKENSSYTNVSSDKNAFNSFTDVTQDAWFFSSVEEAAQKGWIKGVGEKIFAPDETLTGAQWMTILARLAEVDTESGESWYSNAVSWGTENKIIHRNGWSFGENTPITREQMADMIMAFAEAMGADTTGTADLSEFDDESEISEYAQAAFRWAVNAGVLRGDGTSLNPGGTLKRSEAAEVLTKLFRILPQEPNKPIE